MADYFVGDLQGCLDELTKLLTKVKFNPDKDTLWLTGDLVARGPKSLETLRYLRRLGNSAKPVLGNHDLHLIATYMHNKTAKTKDRVQPILDAPDAPHLISWLRQQPLLRRHKNVILTHAGISPQWQVAEAIDYAEEANEIIRSVCCSEYLANMYNQQPASWDPNLSGHERFRYIVNSFTRMRYCSADGELSFTDTNAPSQQTNSKLRPWFEFNEADRKPYRLIFGHWATLQGKTHRKKVIGLDTGCVWGNHMTMYRLNDKKYFRVDSIKESRLNKNSQK